MMIDDEYLWKDFVGAAQAVPWQSYFPTTLGIAVVAFLREKT